MRNCSKGAGNMSSFMDWNLLLLTDSYKFTHWKQYPPGTERIYSYFESRGGDFPSVCFFGLQYYLARYLEGPVVTQAKIDEAEGFCAAHFGQTSLFNRAGWEHILRQHRGRLPVVVKAVPEGTVVPTRNVLMTIENTDPACYWLPNYLETLLVQCWYGSTVATQSAAMKKVLLDFLNRTGDPGLIDFKMHDFGFRGVSSVETAGVGGCAHLVHFKGTDTMAGLVIARDFYGCPMAGFSIPASEHSTITAWGKDHEVDAFANMLDQYPDGLVACVSDSYDIVKAVREYWGGQLKDKILARNGTLVVRPDSGDPIVFVPKLLRFLAESFGAEKNDRGYLVLNPKVRMIQGDGVNFQSMGAILKAMEDQGWSADNIAFGSGGGLLQKLNRDTLQFAFKCSSATIDGKERDVFKQPVTDAGKKSKAGRLKLIRDGAGYRTVLASEAGDDQLIEVFREGRITRRLTLDEVRRNV
jgi:nicotinamide phosphoribosyltransferase